MKKVIVLILLYVPLFFVYATAGCSAKKETSSNINTSGGKTDKVKKLIDFQKDEIVINTSDSKDISANFYYDPVNKETEQPVIVLIHQFKQNKEQWAESFIGNLVNNGYKALAYDIRGHGKSSKVNYDLSKLLTDPVEAPLDVTAVFSWIGQQKGVDTNRIGVLGTSIGGNLACYARYYLKAKAVVSVSSSKDGFFIFAGIDERMMGRVFPRISNVFFICGKRDGSHAQDEKYLLDNYIMDPMDMKVYDSDKHGIFLIEENPEIYDLALNWFKKLL
jgi:dienelactone hydrolase